MDFLTGALPYQLTVWCCVLTFFHVSEFILAWIFMRKDLGWHCEHVTVRLLACSLPIMASMMHTVCGASTCCMS